VLTLGFDWSKLTPRNLGLDTLLQSFAGGRDFDSGNLVGVIFGMAVGTILLIILRLRANRRSRCSAGFLCISTGQQFRETHMDCCSN
jgi:hypothetical protein